MKCVPPDNKPLPAEREMCRSLLDREIALLTRLKVVVCLGGFAHDVACAVWGVRPRPKFGHGAITTTSPTTNGVVLIDSFHPSQQNTFTGRLTEALLDDIMERAVELAR